MGIWERQVRASTHTLCRGGGSPAELTKERLSCHQRVPQPAMLQYSCMQREARTHPVFGRGNQPHLCGEAHQSRLAADERLLGLHTATQNWHAEGGQTGC